ncbi:DNA polymerase-3 subunit delta' [Desulfurobacterium atlanticum]|uniref:DNA polymerase-3 subunit delta n=2 Tax=Desulfurobacterium atlanticum TaxID=240169 RepID=A0A238ZUT3_9BACT|nr:DNA polymerase-3 subunit delta' [Desulfurobacterium atlanticum]
MPFSSIVGHAKQLHTIEELIEKKVFPSSAIFSGPEGVGKKLVAVETAKILSGNEFGIKIVGEDKPPTIDEIREITSWLSMKPTHSKRKIAIIDSAELMRNEAANALLKTLEEPPEYANIILITSNENALLPTIKSRCKIFRFGKLTKIQVETILKNLGVEYDSRILKICGNSPGRAIALSNSKVPDLIAHLLKLLKEKKLPAEILDFSSKFSSMTREETNLFIESLIILFSEKKIFLDWFEPLEKARNFLNFYARPRNVIEWLLITVTLKKEQR